MRRCFIFVVTYIVLGVSQLVLQAQETNNIVQSDSNSLNQSKIYIVPIREQIDGKQEVFIRRSVREANEAEADLIIINMKTPGGSLRSTMEIFDILDSFNKKVVTYINDEAYSAGALIAAVTDEIYMSPEAVIGAATAIMIGPGGAPMEIPEDVSAKFSSALRGKVRSKAAKKGHNPAVFEAMIDMKKELVVDGQTICKEGEILTLTADEAFTQYGDPAKPLLAAGIFEDMDALISHLGFADAQRVEMEHTGTELVGAWLTSISPILLLIAGIGLYMEFKSPGFGVPGLIGIVAAALYFIGGYVAGFSALGWLIVFVIGVILIFGEVLLFPGTFVLGVTGAVLIALSVTMAFLDYDPNYNPEEKPIQQDEIPAIEQVEESESTLSEKSEYINRIVTKRFNELGIVLLGFIVSLVVLAKVLPHTPFYSRIVSTTSSGVESVESRQEENKQLIGAKGVALSDLKPGGKGKFGADVVDIVSDDEWIEKGENIAIVEFRNATAVVVKDSQALT